MGNERVHPTAKAEAFLNKVLRLPATGREQDWDIEMADPNRVNEFLRYAETNTLDEDNRLDLMALIFGSLNDLSDREGAVPAEIWVRIQRLLRVDLVLYADLIKRWSIGDADPEGFAISPLMRAL